MSPEAPRPGWYPDPSDKNSLRLWRGDQWSDQTKPIENKNQETPQLPAKIGSPANKASSPGILSRLKEKSQKEPGLVFLGVSGVIVLALGVGFLGNMKKSETPPGEKPTADAASLIEKKKERPLNRDTKKKAKKKVKPVKKPKRSKKAAPKNVTQPATDEEYTTPTTYYSISKNANSSSKKKSSQGTKRNPGGSKRPAPEGSSAPGGSDPGNLEESGSGAVGD